MSTFNKKDIMSQSYSDLYEMSKNRERKLWKNAIFVFDSSALLKFYIIPENTRRKIFDNWAQAKDKMWLPGQVLFEYQKNRIAKIKEPFITVEGNNLKQVGNYFAINKYSMKELDKFQNEFDKVYKSLFDKTKKDDYHPYLGLSLFEKFDATRIEFKKGFETFKNEIENELKKRNEEKDKLIKDDSVFKALKTIFPETPRPGYDVLCKYAEEGAIRYKNKIAPGFEDAKKKGLAKYGDLFIWKEMIEFSKKEKVNLIFITLDLKDDWWENSKTHLEPNFDLIAEFTHETNGQQFWMYTLHDFLEKSTTYLNLEVNKDEISKFKSSFNQDPYEYNWEQVKKAADQLNRSINTNNELRAFEKFIEGSLIELQEQIRLLDKTNLGELSKLDFDHYYNRLNGLHSQELHYLGILAAIENIGYLELDI